MSDLSGIHVALEGIRYSVDALQAHELTSGTALVHFSALVTRCSQLRNMARREYKRRTGQKCQRNWPYEPWRVPHPDAPVLELMHELRVDDFHSVPFQVGYQEEAVWELAPGMRIQGGRIGYGEGAIQATEPWAVFKDSPPSGISMSTAGPDGEPIDVPKVEARICWVILPGTDAAKSIMDTLQLDSILEIASRALGAAEVYVQWFDTEVPLPT